MSTLKRWIGIVTGLGMLAGCGTATDAELADSGVQAAGQSVAPLADACNLAGTWGIKFVVPVKWAGNLGIQAGSGDIVQWALSERAVETATSVLDTLRPCGSTVPDYKSQSIFGGEQYGIRFPDSLFDSGMLKTTQVRTRLSGSTVGSTFESDLAPIQLGVNLPNPLTDAWPAKLAELVSHVFDADGNGKPGVTLEPATGDGYGLPPVNMGRSKHANQFYVAIRNIAGMKGSLTSCDRIAGVAVIPQIAGKYALNSHVLGCRKVEGGDCTPAEAGLLDRFQPDYQVVGSPTATLVRLDAGATCAAVREGRF